MIKKRMEQSSRRPQIPILFFLLSFANILGVSLSAALPDLREYFQITKGETQNTISLYLVGCFLGTIIYAPIANAIGRKPVIYIGGGIALFGSFLCLVAIQFDSFSLLLLGRCLTAMGAVSGTTLTNLLLADTYPHAEIKRIYSYLMSGFAIIPAIGVMIGGFITEYFSWQGVFYFMLFYTVSVVFASILIPETAKGRDWSHFRPARIVKSYFNEFCNVPFILYVFLVACGSIVVYIFAAEAPFIAIKQLHMSESRYGLFNLIPNIGILLGGFLSAYLGRTHSMNAILGWGGLLFFASSVMMWIFFDQDLGTATLFLFPSVVFLLSIIILSNGVAQAIKMAVNKTYASSLIAMMQYLMIFIGLEALSLFSSQNSSAMPILYTIGGGGVLLLWIVVERGFKAPH